MQRSRLKHCSSKFPNSQRTYSEQKKCNEFKYRRGGLLPLEERYIKTWQNNAKIVCRFVFHSSSHYTINCGATARGYMFKGAKTYVWRHFFRKLPRLVLDYRLYLFVVQVIENSVASEQNEVCVGWKLKYTNLWDCYDAVWISAIALKFCHTIAESSWYLNDLE